MPAYATSTDMATWSSQPQPSDVGALLNRASEVVDAWVTAPFSLDAGGLPSDGTARVALRDATCAQVELWLDQGGETIDIDGRAGQQVTVGDLTIARPAELAGRAARILRQADLL